MSEFDVTINVQGNNHSVLPGAIEGRALYSLTGISSDDYLLLLDRSDEVDIPIAPSDQLIIQGDESFVVSRPCTDLPNNPQLRTAVPFHLNGDAFNGDKAFTKAKVSLEELACKAEISLDDTRIILDLTGLPDQVLKDQCHIVISGDWRLITTPIEPEECITDIEECCEQGIPPGRKHHYAIRVNNTKHKVSVPNMLGRDILALENLEAGKHAPYQRLRGGITKLIDDFEKVDFTQPGIERFTTIPLDMTEGFEARRHFQLPQNDIEFLNSLKLHWEAVKEGHSHRVVIYEFPLPHGYTAPTVTVNMRIEASYPDTQIDMAYFYPAIQRADARAIKAITNDNFDGKNWQRWSRHRTQVNPWRPGIDCIETHVAAIESWLIQEPTK